MTTDADKTFVLGLIDKHSQRHADGCPASQIPLACKDAVQALIAEDAIELVQGGRDGTHTYLRRHTDWTPFRRVTT